VTDEGKKDTEPWIESKGVKYAYAYDKGGKLKGKLGVSGIPHAFLVDATGTVIWEGHPAELQPAQIEKAVTGALTKPMWEWPASAKETRTALLKHKYADALASAAKLTDADGGPAIKASIQGMIASRVNGMKTALTAGNFLSASEAATELSEQLTGLPELSDAKTVADTIKANKDAPAIIKAQKTIREAKNQKLAKAKEMDKAIADMRKIAKDMPGTFAETEAKAFADELDKRKRAPK
jgi:hypothetical protein